MAIQAKLRLLTFIGQIGQQKNEHCERDGAGNKESFSMASDEDPEIARKSFAHVEIVLVAQMSQHGLM
jgi:hypothetical protein